MPNPETITVGAKCFSCALYVSQQCPYGNHKRKHQTRFQGDIRGKCGYYFPIQTASGKSDMKKEASTMKDTELNVELYRRIAKLDNDQRAKLFNYWQKLYGPSYADKMVDDENKSSGAEHPATKILKDKKKKKKSEKPLKSENKFPEDFKSEE